MGAPNYPLIDYPANGTRLTFLKPAVKRMFWIMDRYMEVCKPDRPFFYNERATVSILAGGIWQSNPKNLVLEEAWAEKTRMSGPYTGKDDVWFQVGRQSCYAEAKQCWAFWYRRLKPDEEASASWKG